jgi:hypothetical protein
VATAAAKPGKVSFFLTEFRQLGASATGAMESDGWPSHFLAISLDQVRKPGNA